MQPDVNFAPVFSCAADLSRGNSPMQIGMIGLGRMGASMARRLIKGGHECVVFDRSAKLVQQLVCESAVGAQTWET
jgi:6-phosphogluconate dehydrogenase